MIDLSNCNSFEAYISKDGKDAFELTDVVELNATEDAVLCIANVEHVKVHSVNNVFRIRAYNENKQTFVSVDNEPAVKADVDLSDPTSVTLTFKYQDFDWTIVLT